MYPWFAYGRVMVAASWDTPELLLERFCIGMVGSKQLGVDGVFRGALSVFSSEMFTFPPRPFVVRSQLYYFYTWPITICVEQLGRGHRQGGK